MKKHYLILVLTSFLSLTCDNNNDIINPNNKIESYYYGYMQYPSLVSLNYETDNLVKLEYLNGKIIKRIGEVVPVPQPNAFQYKFTDQIFNQLSYETDNSGNLIINIITYDSIDGIDTDPNKKIITLNSKNQIVELIEERSYGSYTDTTNYFYNSKSELIKAITKEQYSYYSLTKISMFYYSENKNLDSVISQTKNQDEELQLTKKEYFTNYDTASNPIKNLIIFPETFYRALSENNYAHYRMIYNKYNGSHGTEEKEWTFHYDQDGNIIFNNF
jgi:hypothetical protein